MSIFLNRLFSSLADGTVPIKACIKDYELLVKYDKGSDSIKCP